jgi:hypothetical protein
VDSYQALTSKEDSLLSHYTAWSALPSLLL